jgi:hypothetical protein
MQTANPQAWQPSYNYGFRGYQTYAGYNSGPGGVGTYGYYANGPATPYGYNPGYSSVYRPNQGFCGCPSGYIPVCDNSIGMGCTLNTNQAYATWHWNQAQGQYYRGNFGQFGGLYAGQFGASGNSCYSGFGLTCRVGSMDCGSQSICMQTGSNSMIGVCVGM